MRRLKKVAQTNHSPSLARPFRHLPLLNRDNPGQNADMPQVATTVEEIASLPGMDACVLADVDSGMIVHQFGTLPHIERIGEASVEFWRVQERLGEYFQHLGPLGSTAYSFRQHVIALFPTHSQPPMVLICVARKDSINWVSSRDAIARLKQQLTNR